MQSKALAGARSYCMTQIWCRLGRSFLPRRGVISSRSLSPICSRSADRSRAHSHLARATTSVQRQKAFEAISHSPAHTQMDNGFGNFDRLTKFQVQSTNTVISKWRSRQTGLSVVHLDYEGRFCDSLEILCASSDSGSQHLSSRATLPSGQRVSF